jgi:chemotaxis signal transduction protein
MSTESGGGFDWEALKRRSADYGGVRETKDERERVFVERARVLAQADEVRRARTGSAFFSFSHRALRLAVDMAQVVRVLRPRRPTAIPCAPDHLNRVLYEAGRIISVIDVAHLLGRGRAPDGEDLVVLLESGSLWLGVRAERVHGPVQIDLDSLASPSPGLDARVAGSVRGVADDMTIVLDAGTLIRALRQD